LKPLYHGYSCGVRWRGPFRMLLTHDMLFSKRRYQIQIGWSERIADSAAECSVTLMVSACKVPQRMQAVTRLQDARRVCISGQNQR